MLRDRRPAVHPSPLLAPPCHRIGVSSGRQKEQDKRRGMFLAAPILISLLGTLMLGEWIGGSLMAAPDATPGAAFGES